jgi:hypothetical protein
VELKDRPVLNLKFKKRKNIWDVFKSDLKDLKYRNFQIKDYDEIMKLLDSDSTSSK